LDALATVVKTTTAEQGSVWTWLEYAVAAVLQAPSFLYLPELGEVDPEDPKRLRLTSLELGSRLAFLLTNAPPDRELLDAGERGELLVVAALRKQAERLLQTPRARTALDTREAHVNKALAPLYELPAPATDSFTQATHRADRPRAGVMTSAGVMAALSGNQMTSPTFRGLLVRERLLCQQAPEPPDGVNTDLEMVGKARTTRERVEQHRSNAACAACHAFMDLQKHLTPPGGALTRRAACSDGQVRWAPHPCEGALP
jgi:hypothetical protein